MSTSHARAQDIIVTARDFDGLKVLVVEDSAVQCKLICRQISSINATWDVRAAVTERGLAALLSRDGGMEEVDLILLDMNLGDTPSDGFEILRNLKTLHREQLRHTMIIMMSKDCLERELQALQQSWIRAAKKPDGFSINRGLLDARRDGVIGLVADLATAPDEQTAVILR